MSGAVMRALLRVPSLPVRLPRPVVDRLFGLRRYASGVRRKRVSIGRFEIPYLEGGDGPPLLLIHGFSDTKDTFVDVARVLTKKYRVIMPDLPGFGEASAPPDYRYDLPNIAAVMTQFIDALGIGAVHVGGNSLGGATAALVSLERPDLVQSLTLICAAGLVMPQPSPLQQQLDAGENPFVIDTYEEYQSFLRFVLERPPPIPGPIRRHLADDFIARAPLNAKIMDELLADDYDLTPRLGDIAAPTLVIWGDRDRLVDLSVGRLYRDRVPDSRMVVLHGIGHAPQIEAPDRIAGLISDFVR